MDVVGTFIGVDGFPGSRRAASRGTRSGCRCRHACRGPGGRCRAPLPQLLRLKTIEIISGAILPPPPPPPPPPPLVEDAPDPKRALQPERDLGLHVGETSSGRAAWRPAACRTAFCRARIGGRGTSNPRPPPSQPPPPPPQEMPYRARLRQPNGPLRPDTLGSSASSPTSTPSMTISPVMDARSESFPPIFGADSPFMPFSSTKPRIWSSMGSRLGPDDEDVGDRCVGDPGLVAGQTVAGGGLFGARLHAAGIGAGIGLGQAETARSVRAGRQPRQVLLALPLPSHRRGSGA